MSVTRATSHTPAWHCTQCSGLWNSATGVGVPSRRSSAGVSRRFVRAVSETVPAPIVGAYTMTGVGLPGTSCSVTLIFFSR